MNSLGDMEDDLIKQVKEETAKRFIKVISSYRHHFNSIACIKESIGCDDLSTAAEAYYELTDDEKTVLSLAPSKGGIFTTEERRVIKEDMPKFSPNRK